MEQTAKVFIAIEGVVGQALRQVLEVFGITLTANAKEAQLVIAESLRQISQFYRPGCWYAVLRVKDEEGKKPANVRFIPVLEYIPALFEYIQEVGKIAELGQTKPIAAENPTALRPDAKTILVIEDTPRHQASARKLLAGHRLTVIDSYDSAMTELKRMRYEYVLSDLYLPMSAETLFDRAFELGKLVPYGLLLALEAAWQGNTHIAVATDLNHHADAISAAFDRCSQHLYQINGSAVRFLHAPLTEIDGEPAKDWAKIITILDGK